MIVLDASVTASWLLPDEHDEYAVRAVGALGTTPGIVPLLWQFELRNMLLVAMRRGRIPASAMSIAIASAAALPLETDREIGAGDAACALALRHGLTVYDAAYLELACRRGAGLATLDNELIAAARAEGVLWS